MRTASAPASAANLGPAFDVMALALDLRLRVTVSPAADWSVRSGGEAASIETVEMLQAVAGGSWSVDIESDIPQARGLGSSAALRSAFAMAAGADDQDAAFEAAARAEGHRDNVGAACYGGLVVVGPDGSMFRFDLHESLRVLVAVPDQILPTADARAVLTGDLGRDAVRRTSGRVALLVEGLRTADRSMLAGAAGDEVHEMPRDAAFPLTGSLVVAARGAGALHAARSGAGSCAVAFVTDAEADGVQAALEDALADEGTVVEPGVDREGVRLE